MNKMKTLSLSVSSLTLLGLVATGAHAATSFTFDANNNGLAEVTNTHATTYYDNYSHTGNLELEGPTSGKYQTYGLITFAGSGVSSSSFANVNSGTGLNVTFNAYDYGANFETAGNVDFYLVGTPSAIPTTANMEANASNILVTPTQTANPVGVGTTDQGLLGVGSTPIGQLQYTPTYNNTNSSLDGKHHTNIQTTLTLTGSALATFETEAENGTIGLLFTTDTYSGTANATDNADIEFDSYSAAGTFDINSGTTLESTNPEALSFTVNPASASPAPEPSQIGMMALMGLGLGGLIVRARRRAIAA